VSRRNSWGAPPPRREAVVAIAAGVVVEGHAVNEPIMQEQKQEEDMELKEKVEKLERWVLAVNAWAEASGIADSLLMRDGFGSPSHLEACARRDALRVEFADILKK
jgi:hypothetical protein